MRRPTYAAWLLPGLFLLFACSCRRADFPFFTSGGESLTVRKSAGPPLRGPRAGQLHFRLPRRALKPAAGQAFYLRYREPSDPVLLRLYREDDTPAAEALLAAGGSGVVRKYLFLPPDTVLAGFSLQAAGGAPAELEILESGLAAGVRGYSVGAEERVLGTDIAEARVLPGQESIRFLPEAGGREDGEDWGLRISLHADLTVAGEKAGRENGAELELQFGARSAGSARSARSAPERSFAVRLAPAAGDQSQSFYAGVLPFRPETLTVAPADNAAANPPGLDFQVTGVEFFPASLPGADPDAGGNDQPLPADPELILRYDPAHWRYENLEVFRWNRFPDVLIFDTADYAFQDRTFKRLAFFVEKKGFRGRLVSPEEVKNRHGYNAHDYRAEDLARFFTLADAGMTSLSPEETLLRRILLDNQIIREGEEGFLPGRGSVLSISRGSPPALRRHLLTHECMHGVFFSSPDYRAACENVWNSLSAAEQDFWELFLDWQGYDITDSLLVVNEFQAYMLQQPGQGLHYYFQILTRDRLLRRYPEREAEILALVEQAGAGLEEAYGRLEQALRGASGLRGGQVSALRFPAAGEGASAAD
jgi:hypothetical protein